MPAELTDVTRELVELLENLLNELEVDIAQDVDRLAKRRALVNEARVKLGLPPAIAPPCA